MAVTESPPLRYRTLTNNTRKSEKEYDSRNNDTNVNSRRRRCLMDWSMHLDKLAKSLLSWKASNGGAGKCAQQAKIGGIIRWEPAVFKESSGVSLFVSRLSSRERKGIC